MNKVYSFYLNGKPLNAKKFKPTETLDNVRKSLKNKIDSTIIFEYNVMPIDINDESEFSIQEIEDNGKVYLKNNTSNLQSFKIYLNQQLLTEYMGKEDDKIINVRNKLGNTISSGAQFLMHNDTIIEKEDEEGENGFTISDIQKDNIIYIIDENKKQEKKESKRNNENIKNNNNSKKNYILFDENNKKICAVDFSPETPLYLIRKELKKSIENFQNLVFLLKDKKEISKEEEFELEIQDISEDGILFLKNNLLKQSNSDEEKIQELNILMGGTNEDCVEEINPDVIIEQINKQREINTKESEAQIPENRSAVCGGCFIF